jgi:ComF family protein
MKYLDSVIKSIANVLFPPQCIACGIRLADGAVCKPCLEKIPRFKTLFCADCNARLPGIKKICHPDAACVLGAAGPYDDAALKLLIYHLKFRGMRRAAEPLAGLMARYLADIAIDAKKFILIPMPLSRRRQNERGFNQAEEIARHLAGLLGISVRNDVLARNRNTKPQTDTVSAAERRRNILGCFSVVKPDDVRHHDIILLDDVTTSGATLKEAAHALKAARTRRIIGLAAAKA